MRLRHAFPPAGIGAAASGEPSMMRRALQITALAVGLAGCAAPVSGPPGPAQVQDSIVITGNLTNDNAVLLVDGRRNNCRNDEVWRGRSIVLVDNLRRPQNCNSEIVVFSNHWA